MPTTKTTKTDKPFEFEPALKELEDITTWFESTDADLDHGLAKFERGLELAAALKKHLAVVENRIEKIKLKFDSTALTPTSEQPDTYSAPQDFDRSFVDDEAKANGEVEDYPRIGLFS